MGNLGRLMAGSRSIPLLSLQTESGGFQKEGFCRISAVDSLSRVTMDQEYKVIITVELRLLRVAALLRAAA